MIPTDEAAIRADLVEIVRHHYLVVDEHPTFSRMFTFVLVLNKLLGLGVLGLVPVVIRLVAVKPQAKTQGRLNKVQAFMRLPGALDYLKRTALGLQVCVGL